MLEVWKAFFGYILWILWGFTCTVWCISIMKKKLLFLSGRRVKWHKHTTAPGVVSHLVSAHGQTCAQSLIDNMLLQVAIFTSLSSPQLRDQELKLAATIFLELEVLGRRLEAKLKLLLWWFWCEENTLKNFSYRLFWLGWENSVWSVYQWN